LFSQLRSQRIPYLSSYFSSLIPKILDFSLCVHVLSPVCVSLNDISTPSKTHSSPRGKPSLPYLCLSQSDRSLLLALPPLANFHSPSLPSRDKLASLSIRFSRFASTLMPHHRCLAKPRFLSRRQGRHRRPLTELRPFSVAPNSGWPSLLPSCCPCCLCPQNWYYPSSLFRPCGPCAG
jgi:hypothetical protein